MKYKQTWEVFSHREPAIIDIYTVIVFILSIIGISIILASMNAFGIIIEAANTPITELKIVDLIAIIIMVSSILHLFFHMSEKKDEG